MKLHGAKKKEKEKEKETQPEKETKRVCKKNYTKESEKVNALRLNSKNMMK